MLGTMLSSSSSSSSSTQCMDQDNNTNTLSHSQSHSPALCQPSKVFSTPPSTTRHQYATDSTSLLVGIPSAYQSRSGEIYDFKVNGAIANGVFIPKTLVFGNEFQDEAGRHGVQVAKDVRIKGDSGGNNDGYEDSNMSHDSDSGSGFSGNGVLNSNIEECISAMMEIRKSPPTTSNTPAVTPTSISSSSSNSEDVNSASTSLNKPPPTISKKPSLLQVEVCLKHHSSSRLETIRPLVESYIRSIPSPLPFSKVPLPLGTTTENIFLIENVDSIRICELMGTSN
jgi:hypothetical protein